MTALIVLAAAALIWDVSLAGYVAQARAASRPMASLCGLVALLIVPAAVVLVAGSGGIGTEGRTLWGVAWIWPAAVALCVAQAARAVRERLVHRSITVPILVYNGLLLMVAVLRYVAEQGRPLPDWTLAIGAAYGAAMGHLGQGQALGSPYAVLVPLVTPVFPSRGIARGALRAAPAVVATAWVCLGLLAAPDAVRAVRSYDSFTSDSLTARTPTDFVVGLHVLPPVTTAPAPEGLRNDLALVDSTQVGALAITIGPSGARPAALDSVARAFDALRRDSTLLIVTLAPPEPGRRRRGPGAERGSSALASATHVARQLDPDYLVLATGPLDAARQRDVTIAAAAVHAIDRRIRVAVAFSPYRMRDTTSFDWAAGPASPVDVVGFTFAPWFDGAVSIDARLRAADSWMRRFPAREYWVFSAGGFPVTHGEGSQADVIWRILTWATAEPMVKGVVVSQAGDYGWRTGLRSPTGRLRPAVGVVTRVAAAIRADTAAP